MTPANATTKVFPMRIIKPAPFLDTPEFSQTLAEDTGQDLSCYGVPLAQTPNLDPTE